jgi:hypothetical protein
LILRKLNTTADTVEKQELASALREITRKHFGRRTLIDDVYGDSDILIRSYTAWWERGRSMASRDFDVRLRTWKNARALGNAGETEECWNDIRDMGIDIYPLLVDKIRAGENELVPMIAAIARKPIAGDPATRESVLEWWTMEAEKWTLPPPGPIGTHDEAVTPGSKDEKDARDQKRPIAPGAPEPGKKSLDPVLVLGIAAVSFVLGAAAGAGAVIVSLKRRPPPPAKLM